MHIRTKTCMNRLSSYSVKKISKLPWTIIYHINTIILYHERERERDALTTQGGFITDTGCLEILPQNTTHYKRPRLGV